VSSRGISSRFSASRYLAARGWIGAAVAVGAATSGGDTATACGGELATVGGLHLRLFPTAGTGS
jgi:hypothetical protein